MVSRGHGLSSSKISLLGSEDVPYIELGYYKEGNNTESYG